ncbi:MAG: glycoside hydrolase family 31 protein [Tannerella sp.]|jgi:alpha-glucosidase (family GH31 glycosyl hydrolase)|nr:glycoside hydrolase family 31 protein [Tannerella sp.]
MKKHFLTLLFALAFSSLAWGQEALSPNIAYRDAHVRFTVITDGTMRMEWAPDGKFVDQASFLCVNREYPKVDYRLKKSGSWVEITTAKMKLKYKKNSGKFTKDNLFISAAKGQRPFKWHPGLAQTGNLKGTYRTFDGFEGDSSLYNHKLMPIENGLLATDGWTFLDDSHNFLFDHSDWPWVEVRPDNGGQDFYFMAYGHDYKAALKDFTVFAGKVPLPPRFAFGYWWSRYWSYSDNEIHNLLDNFHKYNIPLDVLVVDMDWHYTEPGKGGWTGFTWNRRLFPDPAGFLKYVNDNNLEVTLNLHPAEGVASYEEKYPEMAKWMGIDPATKARIPYVGSDKRYMSGWFNTILHPMMKEGVDFWWLDWQQWPYDKKIKGLNNTWWLNYVFFSDMQRSGDKRPLLYHRWGGLGNHRYQVGFSGDSFHSWKTLAFQPYFTTMASNVLYGYWSHDLGGHQFLPHHHQLDDELFARWMQFGAFSPIMRTHSSKNGQMNKEPWAFDKQYVDVLTQAIRTRYTLAPYIYTMARKTYDTGISLCRPMYYDYPEAKEAYSTEFRDEYMFGDQLLIAPVTTPMKDGYATVKVWLPAGNDWYEWSTGTLLKGGQTVERSFALDEYPVYVKAGSILPLYGQVKNLRGNDETVTACVFPGAKGAFKFYEDNGDDQLYPTQYAFTPFSSEREGNVLTVHIGARTGSYKGMPAQRTYKVKVLCSAVPQSVEMNGQSVPYTYDGNALALTITLPLTDCSQAKSVRITYPSDAPELSDGLYGQFHRFQKAIVALKYRHAGINYTEKLGDMESAGRAVSYYPDQLSRRVSVFRQSYKQLPELLKEQKLKDDEVQWFLQAVQWKQ